MDVLYGILLCLTQLEVLALLGLLGLWGFRKAFGGEKKTTVAPEEVPEEDARLERAWRETMAQVLAYSADTAREAARGDGK